MEQPWRHGCCENIASGRISPLIWPAWNRLTIVFSVVVRCCRGSGGFGAWCPKNGHRAWRPPVFRRTCQKNRQSALAAFARVARSAGMRVRRLYEAGRRRGKARQPQTGNSGKKRQQLFPARGWRYRCRNTAASDMFGGAIRYRALRQSLYGLLNRHSRGTQPVTFLPEASV